MEHKRLYLKISGIVQGVFYRARCRDEAQKLKVTGWVRNRPDGFVELVAEGEESSLLKLISWCQIGPPMAKVFSVDQEWSRASGEFQHFYISR